MAKKGWPYLWGPVAVVAVAGKKVAVDVVEVEEGSRTSLSPADVRSAMPQTTYAIRRVVGGRERGGVVIPLSDVEQGDRQMMRRKWTERDG
ncbi:unnamed protein product [Fusarium graminearum]|nr:unnamed protein product [Fusarium graminearum]